MWNSLRKLTSRSASKASSSGRTRKRPFSKASHVLAWICVFLVVAFGTIQVAHAHNDEAVTHTGCSLCAVVHAELKSTTAFEGHFTLTVFTYIDSSAKTPYFAALTTYALSTRPPPTAILSA